MGFIELFFKLKKEIKEIDIERFVSRKIEENSNLDYKDIKAYHDAEKLSTHISSFANSEGGLIILGISQDEIEDEKGKIAKIYPKEITWGEVSLDKETLENKLLTLIKPPINGLVIKPVRNEKGEVIFLIDIPKSPYAPHMASDHRYHKRINFRKRAMEHFEVANLFRNNWTMKEKLVERIYEPLSSILEQHAKQLMNFACPATHELNDILAKTYYIIQMPLELRELLDYYTEQIETLVRKEHYARRGMLNVVNRVVMEYLKKPVLPLESMWNIELRALSKTGNQVFLHPQDIYLLLLANQEVEILLQKYWSDVYEGISITYSSETYKLELAEFNEQIWKKCLIEVSTNAKVQQFKKIAKSLSEIAWELIEKITTY